MGKLLFFNEELPSSLLTYNPPSFPIKTSPGTKGLNAIACWSTCTFGKVEFQVIPPSTDFSITKPEL